MRPGSRSLPKLTLPNLNLDGFRDFIIYVPRVTCLKTTPDSGWSRKYRGLNNLNRFLVGGGNYIIDTEGP